MADYRVASNYRAVYRSQTIGFSEGDRVDVDPEVADWVNRDSPGCLVPVGAAPVVEPEVAPSPETPKRGKSRARS